MNGRKALEVFASGNTGFRYRNFPITPRAGGQVDAARGVDSVESGAIPPRVRAGSSSNARRAPRGSGIPGLQGAAAERRPSAWRCRPTGAVSERAPARRVEVHEALAHAASAQASLAIRCNAGGLAERVQARRIRASTKSVAAFRRGSPCSRRRVLPGHEWQCRTAAPSRLLDVGGGKPPGTPGLGAMLVNGCPISVSRCRPRADDRRA